MFDFDFYFLNYKVENGISAILGIKLIYLSKSLVTNGIAP